MSTSATDLEALRAAFKEIDKHPILQHEEGDWCDLDPQDDQTVVFYRKSGAPFMWMPYEDWKALRKPDAR